VAAEDYRDNIRLSEEILQRLTDAYRRIRNTCRFILGNLHDFEPSADRIPYGEMEELDRWALHKLQEMSERILEAYDAFEFHTIYHSLHNFCVMDLSSFYLDILKDRLYVSPPKSRLRRSAQTAMWEILETLVRLMAPILSFTADELWQYLGKTGRGSSVHTELFLPVRKEYRDPSLAERWETILKVRKEVTKALEKARKEKRIGHSLDAAVLIGLPEETAALIRSYLDQLRSLLIVSSVRLTTPQALEGVAESEEFPGVRVRVEPCGDLKCGRCWVRDPSVGADKQYPDACSRCVGALREMGFVNR
jgi:isoleucyl-tRNA synthetase